MASCGGCECGYVKTKGGGPSGDRKCQDGSTRSVRGSLSGDIKMKPKPKCNKCGDKCGELASSYTKLPHRQIKVVPYPVQPEDEVAPSKVKDKSQVKDTKNEVKQKSETAINKGVDPVSLPQYAPFVSSSAAAAKPHAVIEVFPPPAVKAVEPTTVKATQPRGGKAVEPHTKHPTEPAPKVATESQTQPDIEVQPDSGIQPSPSEDVTSLEVEPEEDGVKSESCRSPSPDSLDCLVLKTVCDAVNQIGSTIMPDVNPVTAGSASDRPGSGSTEKSFEEFVAEAVMCSIMRAQSDAPSGDALL